MEYVLAVLSHGEPESPTAAATLGSFVERVRPAPAMTVYYHDGPGVAYCGQPDGAKWYRTSPKQLGFCRATGELWHEALKAAATEEIDYVFWLEHDFRFERDVDLEPMALELQRRDTLAQMSLMRQHFPHEIPGIVPWYERELHDGWFSHQRYFTTNPSLMHVDTMLDVPWDASEAECEGKHGLRLIEEDYWFGVWGNGDPWVTHFGQRNGKGY